MLISLSLSLCLSTCPCRTSARPFEIFKSAEAIRILEPVFRRLSSHESPMAPPGQGLTNDIILQFGLSSFFRGGFPRLPTGSAVANRRMANHVGQIDLRAFCFRGRRGRFCEISSKFRSVFSRVRSRLVQGGKKSLPVAIVEFKFDLELQRLCSTHHKGETIPRNHRSQPNSSLEKWQESWHCVRANSDFMILNAWMRNNVNS